MKIWAVAGNQSGFSPYKWIDFPNAHYFQCRKGIVVQLGLSGKRSGSSAGWTHKANYHREMCGAACRSFLPSPLSSWVFKSVLVQLWMFNLLYLSPTPPPLSLLVQVNMVVPEPNEGWVLVGWVPPRRRGLWVHQSRVCLLDINHVVLTKNHQMTSICFPQTLRKN